MLTEIPIFDVDTHYTEPADLWTSRAPSKYKGKVLHVRENERGADAWYVGDTPLGLIGTTVVDRNMDKVLGVLTLPKLNQSARAGSFAPERLSYMDDAGVGNQLVYANVIGFGGQTLMGINNDVDLRLWHVQAYNDAVYDLQKDSGGRILPQAALPLWDIDASLEEMNRVRKMGLTGISMSAKPEDFAQPPLAHPQWERFFDTCQDLELPINFHVGSGTWVGDFQRWWGVDRSVYEADGTHNAPAIIFLTTLGLTGNMRDIANLIMTGMLERYPRLKFVSVESGCGWAPSLIQSLNYNWMEMTSKKHRAAFKRSPKQMFIEQVYCSYWFEDSICVDGYVKYFGGDNLLFETDFPHPTSLYPNNVLKAKVKESLANQPREIQEKILYKNAEKLYGAKVQQPQQRAVT